MSNNTHFLRELLPNKRKHSFRVYIKRYWHIQGVAPKLGFPNWVWLVGGHFEQNGQKLHENDKISILGAKQWGDKPIFQYVVFVRMCLWESKQYYTLL